jgi:hypothetical protein
LGLFDKGLKPFPLFGYPKIRQYQSSLSLCSNAKDGKPQANQTFDYAAIRVVVALYIPKASLFYRENTFFPAFFSQV